MIRINYSSISIGFLSNGVAALSLKRSFHWMNLQELACYWIKVGDVLLDVRTEQMEIHDFRVK